MGRLITGIFRSRSSAELAVEDLNRHGFMPDDISVLAADNSRGREFVIDEQSKAPEGLALGAAIGGIIGAIVLAMMATGMVAIPGANWYFAGSVVPAAAGFAIGALLGGIIGGLIGMSIPEHEAALYRHSIKNAGILVGALAPRNREGEVKQVLQAAGAHLVRAKNLPEERRGYERDVNRIDKGGDQPPPPERFRYSS